MYHWHSNIIQYKLTEAYPMRFREALEQHNPIPLLSFPRQQLPIKDRDKSALLNFCLTKACLLIYSHDILSTNRRLICYLVSLSHMALPPPSVDKNLNPSKTITFLQTLNGCLCLMLHPYHPTLSKAMI